MVQTRDLNNGSVPVFLYGTAWKEERTEALVGQALATGFRAIDTANQRKHYFEAAVGDAIVASDVPRGELFLQSKFTYQRGQDHRLPYDPQAPLAQQVRQSFDSSLAHLHTDYIDSYVLHGPWSGDGIAPQDHEAWGAMEDLAQAGKVKSLGVSNISIDQLRELCEFATHKPLYVQNRCFAATGWDREVRSFCSANDMVYQGFSLLTANRRELSRPKLGLIAERHDVTIAQVVFRFAIAVGMLPLTGTSDSKHIAQDLASVELKLSPDEIATVETVAG